MAATFFSNFKNPKPFFCVRNNDSSRVLYSKLLGILPRKFDNYVDTFSCLIYLFNVKRNEQTEKYKAAGCWSTFIGWAALCAGTAK